MWCKYHGDFDWICWEHIHIWKGYTYIYFIPWNTDTIMWCKYHGDLDWICWEHTHFKGVYINLLYSLNTDTITSHKWPHNTKKKLHVIWILPSKRGCQLNPIDRLSSRSCWPGRKIECLWNYGQGCSHREANWTERWSQLRNRWSMHRTWSPGCTPEDKD